MAMRDVFVAQHPGDLVAVFGAAGGVGQILTAKLLDVGAPTTTTLCITRLPSLSSSCTSSSTEWDGMQRGYRVRAVVRNRGKTSLLPGNGEADGLEVNSNNCQRWATTNI